MKYLEFGSVKDAEARSREEAISRGCGPVTVFWWEVDKRDDGKAGLWIPDGETSALKPEEQAKLVSNPAKGEPG